jgi:hypothetical protein
MANLKETLDYFPHMERSRPMELIGAEFKEKGDSVMWTIFEEIYIRGHGYFCEWNNDVALMFINRPWLSVGVPAVSEILNSMLRRGILDKALFDKYGILTSKEIQEIYFEAVRRRKGVKAVKEYLLVNTSQLHDNVHIISINADIKEENASNRKQIKEKKIKENKRKQKHAVSGIPMMLEDGQTLMITDAEIFHYENSHPDLNVRKELVSASTWLEKNPKGRRSIGQTRKFVERWINRAASGWVKPATAANAAECKPSYDINELDKIDTLDWMDGENADG